MTKRGVCLSTLLVALAGTGGASAQLISIKTVPVAQGDQFAIFPSHNLGMGGVSIALADTLLDPFVNPAKGARLGVARFFGAPVFYSVSTEAGGGRTLPLGALLRAGSWYGGLSLALQEVDASRRNVSPPIFIRLASDAMAQSVPDLGPDARSHGNTFALAMLGKVLPAARLSLAGSVLWARLTAVDGADLLYAGSDHVRQFGHAVDVRLGVLKEWAGDRSLEALVLHTRYGMTHDVTYLDWFWDPGTQQVLLRPRVERNLDRTNTWGLHLEYERPLTAPGWRIGWLATGNRMSHPKIPNYEIMNIPRDPGHSNAYNFGIGISKQRGAATFGIDAIYEPIWSTTWADALAPITTRLGDTIPAGGRTIENHFRFSNALLRMGVSRELEVRGLGRAAALQLGLVVRSTRYWLRQYDHVQVSRRNQEEWWLEWTPTWGVSLRFPELEIRYRGRLTSGTGRPGVAGTASFGVDDRAFATAGILVAPSGPLTLDQVRVVTHQVSLSLPLR
ncbi:MAG: hypothetical protein HYS40_04905 [Gemmatimonadetes bacterium]|nr:hypothetical protein [Gemmatimonadota bacterium]